MKTIAIQVHVDTEIGTRLGIPNLIKLFKDLNIPATFYLSLGPDHTGRAIKRVFRRGFLQKVGRTSVISTYGLRTLLNGTLLPGPHIGKRHTELLRNLKTQGFEVGIHSYDHQRWQDGVNTMSVEQIENELCKATQEFERIFKISSTTAAAPGWQANAKTFAAYDHANFIYASDCRGTSPFFPKVNGQVFRTLQIPTTLPTLDELLGRSEFSLEKIADHYLSLLKPDLPNILTVHAELEGIKYLSWFQNFLQLIKNHLQLKRLDTIANELLLNREQIPVCEVIQKEVDGRSGQLAFQD